MLDEDEFERVIQQLRDGKSELLGIAPAGEAVPEQAVLTTATKRLLDEYNRITGFSETNPNAVWHHRIALYGPACHSCGKPLRTPIARFCAACGATRAGSDSPAA